MSVQILEKDGKPEFAVLPYDEYQRLVEVAEDRADLTLFHEAMAHDEESLPAEVVNRLLDGESPITVWREYRGLKSNELAAATGLTPGYISMLESGDREGTVNSLRAIAKALNVSMDDLIRADIES